MARGNPQPNIQWLNLKNNPVLPISKVRLILSNGSLYFPPFDAENFREDVHWTTYRCSARNTIGTIVSKDTVVKAVVPQRYEPEVQNPGGFIACNVIIKCVIPSFVRDFVTVTSWLQEPNFNIYPSLEGDGKNHMLPTGELLVYNITKHDVEKMYRCRTHHRLTQNTLVSKNAGKIQLTEIQELVPPIINEKILKLRIRIGDPLVVACDAYANPRPTYRWHAEREGDTETLENMVASGRAKTKDGTLIIFSVSKTDNGPFYCTVTNSEGMETFKLELLITSPLSAIIQPSLQTVSLGHTADLICRTFGFPQQNIVWLKDGNRLRTGSRVRLFSSEHIHFSPIVKEDQGMYQCVLRNEWESIQSSSEFRLGEVFPQLNYKFIEQTLQPGPFISLKCSCSGNPTPTIIWFLDGYPLPNDDRIMIGQYVTMFGDVISHVNISAVKSEDGGEYTCKAYSNAGEVTHSAYLNIYGLPYIRPMSILSAVAGKSFSLRCPIAGFPIESVSIEKDGVKLPVNARQRINNATLTIENVQRAADQGTYTCIARNKQNYTSMRSVELKVLIPPKITPFLFARDLNVGDRTSIQCVIGTGDLPLAFTWLKDGHIIKSFVKEDIGRPRNNTDTLVKRLSSVADESFFSLNETSPSEIEDIGSITIRQSDDFSSALSINFVTRSQSGTYTCRVQNNAATVTHSAQLHVNVPPRWIFKPSDKDAIMGSSVIISCVADGFPIPSLQWKQLIGSSGEYRELSYGTEIDILHTVIGNNINNTLMIQTVTREHEGSFLCEVSNGIGSGLSALVKIKVHVGPSVTVCKQLVTIRKGESVTMRCEATGDHPLNISWRSKANTIDDSLKSQFRIQNAQMVNGLSSDLTILQTSILDKGDYTCIASNVYGHDLAVIKLLVHEVPNTPLNLHVTNLESRSVTLSWSSWTRSPESNLSHEIIENSQPISKYILQYKKAEDGWTDYRNQNRLPGDRTTTQLQLLKPAQAYHVRLYSENDIGISAPSDVLFIVTDSEVPSAPPTNVMVDSLGPQQ
ncbi:uncharacterized protein Dana_GF27026 [Drosophila ananassae]|nr:uncharacterized protein Dana_GF27026 [Drosophila ananassae]